MTREPGALVSDDSDQVERRLKTLGLSDAQNARATALLRALLSSDELEAILSSLEQILAVALNDEMQTKKFIKLVHAVDRPLAIPKVTTCAGPDQAIERLFHPVVIPIAGGNTPEKVYESWKAYVKYYEEEAQVPQMKWPSLPGGTTTFFVGAVDIHRRSTGRLRCEASWNEYGEESEILVGSDGKHTWKFEPPPNYASLFSIDVIRAEDDVRDLPVDLLRDDAPVDTSRSPGKLGNLRALAYQFANGKARHIRIRTIATSRFTNYFPRITPELQEKEEKENGYGPRELASAKLAEGELSVWAPATTRPKPPEIDQIVPVFHWSGRERQNGREIEWKRTSSFRIRLHRPWHSSGEDELLGLVCWPQYLVDEDPEVEARSADEVARKSFAHLECELPGAGAFITRWGADPTHLSAFGEPIISAGRFTGYEAKRSNLVLPVSNEIENPTEQMKEQCPDPAPELVMVSVVGYKPVLQPDGFWTCDVAIDSGPAYSPFLQLGLVRYQPHCS